MTLLLLLLIGMGPKIALVPFLEKTKKFDAETQRAWETSAERAAWLARADEFADARQRVADAGVAGVEADAADAVDDRLVVPPARLDLQQLGVRGAGRPGRQRRRPG